MANSLIPGVATNNPQANVQSVENQVPQQAQQNPINPITIPIQIQPQVAPAGQVQPAAQPNTNLQVNNQQIAPTPQVYQKPTTNNNIDFNKIYSSYQSQYGTNPANNGVKTTSLGTTIVTPTINNLNSVEGQYQSAYADTINSLVSELLTRQTSGFQYDPTQDTNLRLASEYAASSAMEQMAARGILNSSSTAERVASVVSELIPQYENLAYTRWTDGINMLTNTANLVMNYDTQQFEYWKDAKDREFKEKEAAYQKEQDALNNAWKRVDELGYVDNNASAILGVPVGTLSGSAREAKEEREFQLQRMREQAQIEYENAKALYKIKSELDIEQQKAITENEYKLASTYGSSSNKANTTSLSTYEKIINNKKWTDYDEFTRKYTVNDTSAAYNFLADEVRNGRLGENDFYALMSMYNIPTPISGLSQNANKYYNDIKAQYDKAAAGVTSAAGKQRLNSITANAINTLYQQDKIEDYEVAIMLSKFGLS